MSAQPNGEWKRLREVWHTEEHELPIAAAVLARRVHRHSRRLRIILGVEVCVTIAVLGMVARLATAVAVPRMLLALATLHTVVVWTFVLWNRRDTWRPAAETTWAFLALERRRALRQGQAAWFMIVVVAAELVLFGVAAAGAERARFSVAAFGVSVVLFGGFTGWGFWWLRRARVALRETAQLAEALGEEGADPS